MTRQLTPSEMEDLTVSLVEAGCLEHDCNAVVCMNCGHIERFPNGEIDLGANGKATFSRNRFDVPHCDNCPE